MTAAEKRIIAAAIAHVARDAIELDLVEAVHALEGPGHATHSRSYGRWP
jgi:hypothetical protein